MIERLWKFLRKKALNRWHETFEAMQEAVAEVLDHLERSRSELDSLMSEEFPSARQLVRPARAQAALRTGPGSSRSGSSRS